MSLPTRTLAIDFGLKRIGLAISDESGQIAFPLNTIIAGKTGNETLAILIQEIEKLEKERKCRINPIVIGLPLHLSGKESTLSGPVRLLGDQLKEKLGKEVILWDERMTSNQANALLKKAGKSRRERTGVVDPVSASLLLENYLNGSK